MLGISFFRQYNSTGGGFLILKQIYSLFNEFVRKLGQKRPDLHTNELNTTFFCSTSPLKAPNRLKSLKLA
jgi:hypothetical protein